jgi:hypothetical protein
VIKRIREEIPKSAIAKKIAMKITVNDTTIVYFVSSLRFGQVTRFISVETSFKNLTGFLTVSANSHTPNPFTTLFLNALYVFHTYDNIYLFEAALSDLEQFSSSNNFLNDTDGRQESLFVT